MPDPVQRVNFFDHQFLHVDDFQTEQAYHIAARQRHNRYLHTPGVAYGLNVAPDGGHTTAVTIGEGMALDADGNEIVVTDTQTLELGTFDADKSVWVVISYASHTARQTTETGVAGDTRVVEEPLIQALDQTAKPSGAGRIVLAQVARSGTNVESVDESPRTLAGSMEGDISLTPQNPATPQSQWVTMSWSAPNRVDLVGTLNVRTPGSAASEGNLSVDGNASVAGTLSVTGPTLLSTAGFGVAAPRARADVAGQAFFRSAAWNGSGPLAAAAGSAGLVAAFDAGNAGGSGFLHAFTAAGVSTRLWFDGDPIIFAPHGSERGRVDAAGNLTLAGAVVVDSGNAFTGAITNAAIAPSLTFGSYYSGEGVGSKRTAGGNQYGLDLYTFYTPRLSITNGGNVGIGTQAPASKLHVNGGFVQSYLTMSGGASWSSIAYNAHHDAGAWTYLDASRKAVTIELDDNAGSPRFQVWSNQGGNPNAWALGIALDGTLNHTGIGGVAQAAFMIAAYGPVAATGFQVWSDRELKKNVRGLSNALENLRALDGVRYEWKKTALRAAGVGSEELAHEGEQIGLVAQQVQERFPELVSSWEGADGKTYHALDYTRLTAVLVEAVKELADRVEALESRVPAE